MAWRLDTCVVRGEIDNTVRGKINGEIWLAQHPRPLRLELTGNAWSDVAGCKIAFHNPQSIARKGLEDLSPMQRGKVGDMTVSRKVRILDVPLDEAKKLSKAGKPIPEHLGNCIYLEWYSQVNGRVVIESTDYCVRISDRTWSMTPEEEKEQVRINQTVRETWMRQILEAELLENAKGEPGESTVLSEFEWEKLLQESDAQTKRFEHLLAMYADHPNCHEILAHEMGWSWANNSMVMNEFAEQAEEGETIKPDPAREGRDWIRCADGRITHPLTYMAHCVAMDMWHFCDERNLLNDHGDHDLRHMVLETQLLTAKLAGALDHLAYDGLDGGFVVACLKRVLGHFNRAMNACEKVRRKHIFEPERIHSYSETMFKLREEILNQIERFRKAP